VSFWTKGGILSKIDASRPLIMGHEASGTIHEIGSAVSSLKVGDNVAIEPGIPCRKCLTCKAGRYNLCSQMVFAAVPPFSHGTLAKYFKMVNLAAYKSEHTLTRPSG
jgi:D-xylulose reductase